MCPGVYRAVGVANGRYVYQREGRDRYLEYTAAGDWMVTESVGGDYRPTVGVRILEFEMPSILVNNKVRSNNNNMGVD